MKRITEDRSGGHAASRCIARRRSVRQLQEQLLQQHHCCWRQRRRPPQQARPQAQGEPPPPTSGDNTGKTMTMTIKLNPKAVWDDGSADHVGRPRVHVEGEPQDTGFVEHDRLRQDHVDRHERSGHVPSSSFNEVYAPYKNLFEPRSSRPTAVEELRRRLDRHRRTASRSRACRGSSTRGARTRLSSSPTTSSGTTTRTPKATRSSWCRRPTPTPRSNSLKSGEVDFIFPQAVRRHHRRPERPEHQVHARLRHELRGLYFQENSRRRPFKDSDFRKAFSKSIDRNLILKNIYDPIFPGAPLLNCGLWVPTIGKWCDNTAVRQQLRPRPGAEKILTDAGWAKGGDGMWAKGGNVPDDPLDGQLRQQPS